MYSCLCCASFVFLICSIAMACWTFHYAKRLFETVFVHRFSHSTMPIRNLFKVCVCVRGRVGRGVGVGMCWCACMCVGSVGVSAYMCAHSGNDSISYFSFTELLLLLVSHNSILIIFRYTCTSVCVCVSL